MLPWEFVEERLTAAPNYWVATVSLGGAPHVRPVDGVWVDGALCFGGSPETRWVRNLQHDPRLSVHLPHDDEVIILEGTADAGDGQFATHWRCIDTCQPGQVSAVLHRRR